MLESTETVPQGLKLHCLCAIYGTTEVVPFQNGIRIKTAIQLMPFKTAIQLMLFQNGNRIGGSRRRDAEGVCSFSEMKSRDDRLDRMFAGKRLADAMELQRSFRMAEVEPIGMIRPAAQGNGGGCKRREIVY